LQFVCYLFLSVLQSINFLFFLRVFHAAIVVSALISRAKAVISKQENFWPFSVKTYLVVAKGRARFISGLNVCANSCLPCREPKVIVRGSFVARIICFSLLPREMRSLFNRGALCLSRGIPNDPFHWERPRLTSQFGQVCGEQF